MVKLIPLTEGKIGLVDIEKIIPEDCNHHNSPYDETRKWGDKGSREKHIESIKVCEEVIKTHSIDEIRPIICYAVTRDKLQRTDGYVRYWAFKNQGYKQIPVQLVNRRAGAGQDKLPWLLTKEEKEIVKKYYD